MTRTADPPARAAGSTRPVLWHIAVSHYSEKARWALAHKGVEHDRRAPVPGLHIPIAMALTRSTHHTFPVLSLDGETIGGSAAIIAALEKRFPEPPLYPADPAERARALELERYFDDELGPSIRLLAWHELRTDPDRMEALAEGMIPGPLRGSGLARRAGGAFGSAYVQLRFRVADESAAEAARARIGECAARLESELEASGGEYLAGGAFSVADLTAASLLYPAVRPPEGPALPPPTERLDRFFAPLRERPAGRWALEMFRRHRKATPAPGAG